MAFDQVGYLEHYKKKLERGVDEEKKLEILKKMLKFPMTYDLLKQTRIGKTIKQLSKGKGKSSEDALVVLQKWESTSEKALKSSKKVILESSSKKESHEKQSAAVCDNPHKRKNTEQTNGVCHSEPSEITNSHKSLSKKMKMDNGMSMNYPKNEYPTSESKYSAANGIVTKYNVNSNTIEGCSKYRLSEPDNPDDYAYNPEFPEIILPSVNMNKFEYKPTPINLIHKIKTEKIEVDERSEEKVKISNGKDFSKKHSKDKLSDVNKQGSIKEKKIKVKVEVTNGGSSDKYKAKTMDSKYALDFKHTSDSGVEKVSKAGKPQKTSLPISIKKEKESHYTPFTFFPEDESPSLCIPIKKEKEKHNLSGANKREKLSSPMIIKKERKSESPVLDDSVASNKEIKSSNKHEKSFKRIQHQNHEKVKDQNHVVEKLKSKEHSHSHKKLKSSDKNQSNEAKNVSEGTPHIKKEKSNPLVKVVKKEKVCDAEAFTASEVSFEDCLGFNDIVTLKKKKAPVKVSSSKTTPVKTSNSKSSSVKVPNSKSLPVSNSKNSLDKVKSSTSSEKTKFKAQESDLLKEHTSKSSKDKDKSSKDKDKSSKDKDRSSKKKKSKEDSKENSRSSIIVPKPSDDFEPVNILSTLPEIQPYYRPLPRFDLDYGSPKKKTLSNEEAILFTSSRKEKTAVYSGRRNFFVSDVTSLFDICVRFYADNIDTLIYVPPLDIMFVRPIFQACTPQRLLKLEDYNPHILDYSHELWEKHCKRDFRKEPLQEGETWRELYLRAFDEKRRKLKALTANISASMSKANPVRQVKLAYVDSTVKPPRDILRKQAKHGTGLPVNHVMKAGPPSKASPRPTAPVTNATVAKAVSQPPTPQQLKKPKVAPLMAKTLKAMKQVYRR